MNRVRMPVVSVMTALLVLCTPAMSPVFAEEAAEEKRGEPEPLEKALEKEWSLNLNATYSSKKVWRGICATDDPVLQHYIALSYKGLSLAFWGNMDTTDFKDYRRQYEELDYILNYSWSWEKLNFSVGGIYYQYPQAHRFSTTEVYFGVGVKTLLSPTFTVYQDVDENEGTYATLSLGHTFKDVWKPSATTTMSVAITTSFAYGWSRHNLWYYGSDGSGFADAKVSLGLPFQIGDHVTVTPAIHYSVLLDDNIRSAMRDDDNFWAGLTFTYAF